MSIPCWSYNIPLNGRLLFYLTRFFDLQACLSVSRKTLLQIYASCPKHSVRLSHMACPCRPWAPPFSERQNWCVTRDSKPPALRGEGCPLEPWSPCQGEGGVWHLGWMNTPFSGQHSCQEKVETPGNRGCRNLAFTPSAPSTTLPTFCSYTFSWVRWAQGHPHETA